MRKNFLKKTVLSALVSLVLISSTVRAQATILHERKTSRQISSGVVHEHIQKLTTSGWRNINVIRVDLTNPYADIRGIMNPSGLSYRDTVSNMVEKNGAIAGINGDYFSYSPIAHSVGGLINDGEIIVSPIEKAHYASPSIYIDNSNQAFIDYLDRRILVRNISQDKLINPYTINKLSDGFKNISLLNKNWGYKSPGNKFHSDMVELVVSDGQVIDIRENLPATDIPRDGFVLVARAENGNILKEFQIGDQVELEAGISPSLDGIKFAIGGGSIILKDGNPSLTNIHSKGSHPRTGIGINQDRTQLIMVTLDGRGVFKGMEQKQFGGLMRELGAYNALNLDGGGSTTMAIKEDKDKKAQPVNTPSGKSERMVVNGVGVFAKETPIEDISYIKARPEDSNFVFKGSSKLIFVDAYDRHGNKLDMDSSQIEYRPEDSKGQMQGNLFLAKEQGKARIKVSYMGLEDWVELNILGQVQHLDTYMKEFRLEPSSSKELANFTGYDGNGNKAKIYAQDVDFEITGDIGKIQANIFTASDQASSGFITARFGNGLSHIAFASPGMTYPNKEAASLAKESKDRDIKRLASKDKDYSLAVVSDPKDLNKLVNYDAVKDIVARLKKHEAVLYLGGASKDFSNRVGNSTSFHSNNNYRLNHYQDLSILSLNTSKRGLRESSPKQWLSFKEDIKNIQNKNIIVSLTRPVFGEGGFSDSLEAQLFHEILREQALEGKNIFVVQAAGLTSAMTKDGIRYIQLNTKPSKAAPDKYNIPILEFNYKDGDLTYTLDSIFKKP